MFKDRYWFDGMYSYVEKKCKECLGCTQKRKANVSKTPLQPIPAASGIFARVHIDITGGFVDVTKKLFYIMYLNQFCCKTNGIAKHLILSVCALTKYVDAAAIPTDNSFEIAKYIYQQIFCRYLAPSEVLIHDRGNTFCAKVVKDLLEKFNCRVNVTTAGRPQANGQVEIMMKTFKERLNAMQQKNGIFFTLEF